MEWVAGHSRQALFRRQLLASLKELIYGKCSKVLKEVDSGR